MKKTIFNKTYHGFEDVVDLERDISEMWYDSGLPGEFQGKVKVTVEYEGDDVKVEELPIGPNSSIFQGGKL